MSKVGHYVFYTCLRSRGATSSNKESLFEPFRKKLDSLKTWHRRTLTLFDTIDADLSELENFPSLKTGLALGAESGFGFALPKNSPLTGPLTEHIKKLKQSGIYFRLVTTHMGPRASAIVRAAKIE